MKKPSPDSKALDRALSDTKAMGAVKSSRPDLDSLKREFGRNLKVKDLPDGTKKIVLKDHNPGRPLLKRLDQMFLESNRKWCDVGAEQHSRFREVDVRTPDGQIRRIREEQEEAFGRKTGALRVRRFGGFRIRADANGYLWRQVSEDRWEPTHKKQVGVLVEPDPFCRCVACEAQVPEEAQA